MKTYQIEIRELLSKVITIKADSSLHAIGLVKDKYEKTDIVLDYRDFSEVDFVDINADETKPVK
jgi:hypothetical protein